MGGGWLEGQDHRGLHSLKFGILLKALNPSIWAEAVAAADELGFESVWIADHLVFPVEMRGELVPGEEHPPVDPHVPVFDVPAQLSFFAATTSRIRLGVYVYLLALRHPFVTARGFATLDVVSGGRAELGVGAGWLVNEFTAAGIDPATRGRRLDECLAVCRRLWTEPVVEHHGEFFDFEPVAFEPKPIQRPHPPIAVGGESERAMRRAAGADGWMALVHTPESAAPLVARYRTIEAQVDRDAPGVISLTAPDPSAHDIDRFARLGVDRLIVAPWRSTRDAIAQMTAFAGRHIS